MWLRGQAFRLLGCNARELAEPGGVEARDHLAGLVLDVGVPVGLGRRGVVLTSVKRDKYGGRYDAAVTLPDGSDLVAGLIAGQWAAPWDGRGPRPVPPWPRTVP
jgi:endonuclease YncB( thermonuclease family)